MCQKLVGPILAAFLAVAVLAPRVRGQSPDDIYRQQAARWQQQEDQHQQEWEKWVAQQRTNAARERWFGVGALVFVFGWMVYDSVVARRRYLQTCAKYEEYLAAIEKRDERIATALEKLDRRIGGSK